MQHSQETIQSLHAARLAGLRAASESRNVDALMSWHSKDGVFTDVVNNITHSGIDAIRAFYTGAYAMMPTFRITPTKVTGPTPEFVAAEMRCEGETAGGETMRLVGVSLFWWRWEGEREWDGSLGDEGVRGWKIVRERAYYTPHPPPRRADPPDSRSPRT
jgi:ketosteroid isomerase-like protein